ncbi:hypothetical protein [Pararhodobacter sp.]|uniref:hypothetical protein n=1 Tax=Pararhodobacter sp. TaxID=2127056 RepID=UPI002FDCE78F
MPGTTQKASAIPGPGHNNGPSMEPGAGWRRHCWSVAREALLPTLPIEVLRQRVKRAAEIGLDYRTYASIRAASGHDVVAFLFSTNALHLLPRRPDLSENRARRLETVAGAGRAALAQAPLSPADLSRFMPALLDHASQAPAPYAPWSEARARVLGALTGPGWPRGGVVLVGDTGPEHEWALAARLGYYLPAERFFAA